MGAPNGGEGNVIIARGFRNGLRWKKSILRLRISESLLQNKRPGFNELPSPFPLEPSTNPVGDWLGLLTEVTVGHRKDRLYRER